MVNADDLRQYLKAQREDIESKVDQWLKEEVFPNFKDGQCLGREVPKWITTTSLVRILDRRGFDVTSHVGYKGSFVYISLPPSGE